MSMLLGPSGIFLIIAGFFICIFNSRPEANLSVWCVWATFFCGLFGPVLIAAANRIEKLEEENKQNNSPQT